MNTEIKCCLRTSIELKSTGINLVTNHCYYPKGNLVVPSYEVQGMDEYFPILTLAEGMNLLYYFGFAVCIRFEQRLVWVTDEVDTTQFQVADPENYDTYNEADLVATIIMMMIRGKLLTVDLVNDWLKKETGRWELARVIEIHNSHETKGD